MIFKISQTQNKKLATYLQRWRIDLIQKGILIDIVKNDKKEGYGKTDFDIVIFPENNYPAPFWKFDERKKKHIIGIPDNILKNNKDIAETMRSFLHEFAHARYTEKDIKTATGKLKKEDVPFDVLNIFEDIRIERKIEKYLKEPIFKYPENKYKVTFYEKVEIEPQDNVFQVLIKLLMFSGYHTSKAYANPYFMDVKDFVDRAINSKTTDEVIDISIEFYKKYEEKLPFKNREERKKQHKEILISAGVDEKTAEEIINIEDLELSDEQLDDLLKKSESIINCDINEKKIKIKCPLKGAGNTNITLDDFTNDELIPKQPEKEIETTKEFIKDLQDTKSLIEKLLAPISKKKKIQDFEGEEINIDESINFVTGIDYEAKLINKTYKEKEKFNKNFLFFLDLSGSMDNYPINTAKLILLAINKMIAENKIKEGYIVFFKNGNYQTVKMPLNPDIILSIQADGATEGIANAINATKIIQDKSDYIIVMSDLLFSSEEKKAFKKFFNESKNKEKKFLLYANDYQPEYIEKKIREDYQIDKYFVNQNRIELVKEFIEFANNGKLKKKNNITKTNKIKVK